MNTSASVCDECQESTHRIHRIDAGKRYCASCYARTFTRQMCGRCGGTARARQGVAEPLCWRCRTSGRSCARCELPVAKAGALVGGKPVCNSCAALFRDERSCNYCGQTSRHLSRDLTQGFVDPACPKCRRANHATCHQCGRHRKIALLDPTGRALCKQCSSGEAVEACCAECGTHSPQARPICPACSLRSRVARRIALNQELIEQDWVRALFLEFCGWSGLPREAGNMTSRIDKYAVWFSEIDRRFCSPTGIECVRLFEVFGADGLRRAFYAAAFLSERLGFSWSWRELKDLIEVRRINDMVASIIEQPWSRDYKQYVAHLMESTKSGLGLRTARLYSSAVATLLMNTEVRSFLDLTDETMDQLLARHPGHRANAAPFLRFLHEDFDLALRVKKKPSITSLRVRDKKLVASVSRLITELSGTDDPRKGRAFLAMAISKVHRVSLSKVLEVTKHDVHVSGDQVTLWPNVEEDRVAITPPLSNAWSRWCSNSNGAFLFTGRNGMQPMSTAAVWHHARQRDR